MASRILFVFLVWSVARLSVAAGEPTVLEVAPERVPQVRTFDGVVEAVNQSTVSAQISGQIVSIYFDVDDYVEAGEVLLRFRDTEQRAAVEAARASLREAEARAEQAEAEYRRVQEVYRKKVVSKSVLDKAKADHDSAQAQLRAARARLRQAEEQLEHTVVRAPYSGIVVQRHVEVGEVANRGQPLMTGLSLEKLRVVVHLPQTLMPVVRANAAVTMVLNHGERIPLDRAEMVIFPYADPRSHTIRVRIELPEKIALLYPGMHVGMAFETGAVERFLIPQGAVVRRSEVTAVYVVREDGAVVFRQVRLGLPRGGDRIEVLAGLEAGERVALDPIAAGVRLKEQLGGADSQVHR